MDKILFTKFIKKLVEGKLMRNAGVTSMHARQAEHIDSEGRMRFRATSTKTLALKNLVIEKFSAPKV